MPPPPPEPRHPAVLEVVGVSKSFPGVQALRGVNLQVCAGEVHALLGENGAGKSTLMKILAGAYRADAGEVRVHGQPARLGSPLEARAAGINLIYQEPNVVPRLTVAENIFMGCERRRGLLLDTKAMNIRSEMMLERLRARFSSNALVADLTIAERQIVEIARALLLEGRTLLMDEPTAALSATETAALFEVIAQLRVDGVAIVYTSHRVNEVYALADRVSVLRNGENAGSLEREDITPERIVQLMVGREHQPFRRTARGHRATQPALEVRGLTDGKRLGPVSFRVESGEVLGLAGIVGAGRSELARLVFGADRKAQGAILVDGEPRVIRSPLDAIRAGLGYVPENAHDEGMFPELSARDNVVMPILERHTRLGFLDGRALSTAFHEVAHALRIAPKPALSRAQHLSTGTRQKLLIARWLALKPRVLILDEPTKGVDVDSRNEVYRIISGLADDGMAVVLIASDLSELEHLCDRVIVMRQGELVAELDRDKGDAITQEDMAALATGVRATRDFDRA